MGELDGFWRGPHFERGDHGVNLGCRPAVGRTRLAQQVDVLARRVDHPGFGRAALQLSHVALDRRPVVAHQRHGDRRGVVPVVSFTVADPRKRERLDDSGESGRLRPRRCVRLHLEERRHTQPGVDLRTVGIEALLVVLDGLVEQLRLTAVAEQRRVRLTEQAVHDVGRLAVTHELLEDLAGSGRVATLKECKRPCTPRDGVRLELGRCARIDVQQVRPRAMFGKRTDEPHQERVGGLTEVDLGGERAQRIDRCVGVARPGQRNLQARLACAQTAHDAGGMGAQRHPDTPECVPRRRNSRRGGRQREPGDAVEGHAPAPLRFGGIDTEARERRVEQRRQLALRLAVRCVGQKVLPDEVDPTAGERVLETSVQCGLRGYGQ